MIDLLLTEKNLNGRRDVESRRPLFFFRDKSWRIRKEWGRDNSKTIRYKICPQLLYITAIYIYARAKAFVYIWSWRMNSFLACFLPRISAVAVALAKGRENSLPTRISSIMVLREIKLRGGTSLFYVYFWWSFANQRANSGWKRRGNTIHGTFVVHGEIPSSRPRRIARRARFRGFRTSGKTRLVERVVHTTTRAFVLYFIFFFFLINAAHSTARRVRPRVCTRAMRARKKEILDRESTEFKFEKFYFSGGTERKYNYRVAVSDERCLDSSEERSRWLRTWDNHCTGTESITRESLCCFVCLFRSEAKI